MASETGNTRQLAATTAWIKEVDLSDVVTIEDVLDPPESVSLDLAGDVLKVSGQAHHNWITDMRGRAKKLPGVTGLLDAGLIDLDAVRFEDLHERIESASVLFSLGSSFLEVRQVEALQRLVPELRELTELGRVLDQKLVIHVIGHADRLGSDSFNRMLRLERAKAVRSALIESGIAESDLKFSGADAESALAAALDPDLQAANRRVTFQIELLDADPSGKSD